MPDIILGLAVAAGLFIYLGVALIAPSGSEGTAMTLISYLLYFAVLTGLAIGLAQWMQRVFEGRAPLLARVDRAILRAAGVNSNRQMNWRSAQRLY